jgi:hypothetical protein
MKLLYEGGPWLIPICGLLFIFVFLLVLFLDSFIARLSRAKHRRSVEARRRHRSF